MSCRQKEVAKTASHLRVDFESRVGCPAQQRGVEATRVSRPVGILSPVGRCGARVVGWRKGAREHCKKSRKTDKGVR